MVNDTVETHKEDENTLYVSENNQETKEGEVVSSDKVAEETQTADTEIINDRKEQTVEVIAEEQVASEEAKEMGEAEVAEEAREVEEFEEVEEDELSRLTKQLQAKEQEVKEHYEARLRLQAEFDNFKKRQEKEISNFRKYANEGFIQEILLVVDDFERAIAAAEQTHKLEDFLKGVELIFSKFLDVLQKKGVKEIEAAEGQPFNPEIHEAVTQIESDDVEEGAIVQVFQKGYYLHDRIIRAPKVGVAKKKEES